MFTYLIDSAQELDQRRAAQRVHNDKKATVHNGVGAEVQLLQSGVHAHRFRNGPRPPLSHVVVPEVKG